MFHIHYSFFFLDLQDSDALYAYYYIKKCVSHTFAVAYTVVREYKCGSDDVAAVSALRGPFFLFQQTLPKRAAT